jgi:hypothetical protein
MHDVMSDVKDVVGLLESQAPYNPLGGWYNPGADPHARTRPLWFQRDWVHDDFAAEGSDLFLQHPGYIEAAKQFYDAEVVEPKSVYVNLMTAIAGGGPAHRTIRGFTVATAPTLRCGFSGPCCGPGCSSRSRSCRPPPSGG